MQIHVSYHFCRLVAVKWVSGVQVNHADAPLLEAPFLVIIFDSWTTITDIFSTELARRFQSRTLDCVEWSTETHHQTLIMVQKRSLDDSEVVSTIKPKTAKLETHTLDNEVGYATQPSTGDQHQNNDASVASAPPKSKAARFNARTLKKLQAALDRDPEIDLTTQMPMDYSARLVRFQKEPQEKAKEAIGKFYWKPRSMQH